MEKTNKRLASTIKLPMLLPSMFTFLQDTYLNFIRTFGNPTETLKVGNNVQLTTSSHYDRNPSFFKPVMAHVTLAPNRNSARANHLYR
jgi:hypothetical protein